MNPSKKGGREALLRLLGKEVHIADNTPGIGLAAQNSHFLSSIISPPGIINFKKWKGLFDSKKSKVLQDASFSCCINISAFQRNIR